MRAVLHLLLTLAAVTGCAGAFADDGGAPVVRLDVEPEEVTVGSPLRLRLTVLVPSWFTQPPQYPSLELANLVVREPSGNSFNINERIAGQSYVGIVRDFELYPQRAARYTLDGLTLTVRYADPATRETLTVRLPVPPAAFSARVPPGAEGLDPFLASPALELEQQVEGLAESLAPGDAVTRTVSASATALPAMFLPPLLDDSAPAGLRAYAGTPLVADTPGQRGDPGTGRRTESLTYVVEAPGAYTLPALRLQWWNPESGRVEQSEVAAVTFQVARPPGWRSPEELARERAAAKRRLPWIVAAVVLLLAMVSVAVAARRRLVAWWIDAAHRRAVSEPVLYRALDHAAATLAPGEIYRCFAAWRDVADRRHGQVPATPPSTMPALERVLFAGGDAATIDRDELRVSLGSLRAELLERARRQERRSAALRALNP